MLPVRSEVPRTNQLQPSAVATSLEPVGAHPIILRAYFPMEITAQLVSWGNPEGEVTNSDVDIVIHHVCISDCFKTFNRNTLSPRYNMAVIWWKRKRVGNINVSASPPFMPTSHSLTVPLLYTSPSLCEWGRQQKFRPPVFITRPNRLHFTFTHGRFASTESAM